MKITRLGHSCLLVEEIGIRLLIDPGTYSSVPENIGKLDAVIYTHEHTDHIDVDLASKLLASQSDLAFYSNFGASKLLDEKGISPQIIADGTKLNIVGVEIEGVGNEHAVLHSEWPLCSNTGLFINSKLFYPGDSLVVPGKPVEVLALPVAGPWVRVGEAIDYCLKVAPKIAFPVHDGMLKDDRVGSAHRLSSTILPKHGITFQTILAGQSLEI